MGSGCYPRRLRLQDAGFLGGGGGTNKKRNKNDGAIQHTNGLRLSMTNHHSKLYRVAVFSRFLPALCGAPEAEVALRDVVVLSL